MSRQADSFSPCGRRWREAPDEGSTGIAGWLASGNSPASRDPSSGGHPPATFSREGRRTRGALASETFALVSAAGLSACGFTPLYGDQAVTAGLSHVQVVAPQGRVGFLLGQDLDDDFGRAKGDAPAYRLDIVLDQTRSAHGLRADATAQRYELDLTVTYTLTDLSTGKVAHTGAATSAVSYDSADQPYAGIAAREDTENRLASDAAQKIETQIATWMAGEPAS